MWIWNEYIAEEWQEPLYDADFVFSNKFAQIS